MARLQHSLRIQGVMCHLGKYSVVIPVDFATYVAILFLPTATVAAYILSNSGIAPKTNRPRIQAVVFVFTTNIIMAAMTGNC
jgi:hypothetical protein